MERDEIVKELFRMRDAEYASFQKGLIPGVGETEMIGVRTPDLRRFASQLMKEGKSEGFLNQLPHEYFDENQLHAFMISKMKNFDECINQVNRFLPYVDNWATCDQLSPAVFAKNKEKLQPHIRRWIGSKETYTVRFAIRMLMGYFLDDDFDPVYPEMVAAVSSDEYYINMMIAWYFATALAKQYDAVIPYIEERRLSAWTHNKTIQKCVESYRISDEHKAYLRTLKVRK